MMKQRRTFKMIKSLGIALLMMVSMTVAANAATVLSSDKASVSGCTTLGIDGKYITQAAAATVRINEIRKEACAQGVLNPSTKKPLTMKDYVPVQWSSDMEYIARIRAAEASLTLDHIRTDNSSCFNIKSPNGQLSYSEVLSWCWDETMLSGIELWYSEKADYIATKGNGNAYEIGHYATLINPKYKYYGLATFCSSSVSYYNTTCGQFSKNAGSSTAAMAGYSSCTQLVNVSNNFITSNANGAASVNVDGFRASGLHVVTDAAVKSAERETKEVATALPDTWNSKDASFALKNGYAVYSKYIGNGGSVKVPDSVTVNGTTLKVTQIAPNAFNNAAGKKVTAIQIGKSVTTIGSNAFNNCKKLKTMKIQSKNITKMASGSFKNLSSKVKFTLPSASRKAYVKMIKKAGFKGNLK